jgi:hypothetical protein
LLKLPRLIVNRVITVHSERLDQLDKWTSELLDIIDSYGGTNPYPRFFVEDSDTDHETWWGYSLTTKITKAAAEEFDKEIKEWRDKNIGY